MYACVVAYYKEFGRFNRYCLCLNSEDISDFAVYLVSFYNSPSESVLVVGFTYDDFA